jgi:hypothetical protein
MSAVSMNELTFAGWLAEFTAVRAAAREEAGETVLIAVVGSHLGVRIWNFGPKKPSNVRISTKNILTFDGPARGLTFKRHRLV